MTAPTGVAAASTSSSIACASAARTSSGAGASRCFAVSPRKGTTTVGMPSRDYPAVQGSPPDNPEIASRLDQFASLLELAGAGPYTARAYRRAADLIRSTPAPVAELVRQGRARELRGIGPGVERRLPGVVGKGARSQVGGVRGEGFPGPAGARRLP